MENETGIVATEVLHLMKRSLKRMYGLLIIFIILFVSSSSLIFPATTFINSIIFLAM